MFVSREARKKACDDVKAHYRSMGDHYIEMRYEDLFGRGS